MVGEKNKDIIENDKCFSNTKVTENEIYDNFKYSSKNVCKEMILNTTK